MVTQRWEEVTGPSPSSLAQLVKKHNETGRKQKKWVDNVTKNLSKVEIYYTNKSVNLE